MVECLLCKCLLSHKYIYILYIYFFFIKEKINLTSIALKHEEFVFAVAPVLSKLFNQQFPFFFFKKYFYFVVLRIESRVSCITGKLSTTELCLQSLAFFIRR
jgi:hypothetical protein